MANEGHFTAGVSMAILGNVLISIALNTQRLAHKRMLSRRERDLEERQNSSSEDRATDRQYMNDGLWLVGFTLMTVGEMGNFVAYGLAPASVVSPLGVSALLSNCIVGPLIFDDSIGFSTAGAVLIVIVGILFIVLSAQSSETPGVGDPLQLIWDIAQNPRFHFYLVVTICLIVLVASYVQSAFTTVTSRKSPRYMVANIALVALFGAYTALSTKCVSTLITSNVWNALQLPVTYFLGGLVISTASLQVIYLNQALKIFDASKVIPAHFVFFTLSVIIGSAVIFDDFEKKSAEEIFGFFTGCLLTFLGVWMITSQEKSSMTFNTSINSVINAPASDQESDTERLLDDTHVAQPTGGRAKTVIPRAELLLNADMILRASSSTLFPSPGTSHEDEHHFTESSGSGRQS